MGNGPPFLCLADSSLGGSQLFDVKSELRAEIVKFSAYVQEDPTDGAQRRL